MYLSAAEEQQLQHFNPPTMTPEVFEKYLPYAIAFKVEKVWGNRFQGMISSALIDPNYRPGWYSGSIINYGAFSAHMNSSLSSSVQSSSTPPSKSGGSGGGGFSGGGGGGGGGRRVVGGLGPDRSGPSSPRVRTPTPTSSVSGHPSPGTTASAATTGYCRDLRTQAMRSLSPSPSDPAFPTRTASPNAYHR
jgi:hypothetical protein